MNRPFCSRALRFTTSICSDRAENVYIGSFTMRLVEETLGKITKKNIMMLQMPEKDTMAQKWLHDFVCSEHAEGSKNSAKKRTAAITFAWLLLFIG